jgi:hypothetical protein
MEIEGMPEQNRLLTLARLEAARPGLSALAAGALAGPATPDRPNVPIWDYASHVHEHSDIHLEDLVNVRFPVVFYGGADFTIDSAAEYLRTDSVAAPVPVTLPSVLELWQRLHDAGIVEWDRERRAVVHLKPLGEHSAVVADWELSRRQQSGPPAAR